MLVSAFRPH